MRDLKNGNLKHKNEWSFWIDLSFFMK